MTRQRVTDRNPRVLRVFCAPDATGTDDFEAGDRIWKSALAAHGAFGERLLTPPECASVRRAMDEGVADEAEVLEGVDARASRHVRLASSIDVDTRTCAAVEAEVDRIRPLVAAHFGRELTAREGAGFICYPSGGFYRPHRDRALHSPAWPGAQQRVVSLVLFLNSGGAARGGFAGGELRLLEVGLEVVPREGCCVAFPSEWLHEVAPVTTGARHAVVDWFY